MEISYNRGLVVKENNFKILLDPEYRKTPLGLHTLVTHSHADHTQSVAGSSTTHMNQISLDLYKVSHETHSQNVIVHNNYEEFEIGPFSIEFIQAGHLLGAVQMVIRSGEEGFLYTGDFCPEPLLTVGGADISSDINIMALDATYGEYRLRFNPRQSSRTSILTWLVKSLQMGKLPIINVAKLGGGQEIIAYINTMFPDLPMFVDKKIAKINQVYEEHGIELHYEVIGEKPPEKCVVLIPRPTKELKHDFGRDVTRCIVTGQSAKFGYSRFDNAIPLSTHASFIEIMKHIKDIEPRHVLTNFGYHKELANYLSSSTEVKCNAESVKEISNVSCSNYRLAQSKSQGVDFYFID